MSRRTAITPLLACVAIALMCRNLKAEPTTRPFPAVEYEHEVRKDPALHLHKVKIDLTDPRVKLRVCRAGPDPDGPGPWQTKLLPTSVIVYRENLDIAVNGDFFIPKDKLNFGGKQVPYYPGNWAEACGMAMSDGVLWSNKPNWAGLAVDERGRVMIGMLNAVPKGARQMVGGSNVILSDGKVTAESKDKAPRTAVGYNARRTMLVLLVVDGRRDDYSAGLTLGELAAEMKAMGCVDALNLDGGGSSTLVMFNDATATVELVNRPSDGHDFNPPFSLERSVANVLGVTIEREKPATRPAAASRPGR